MTPDNIVAALGHLCGRGQVTVRNGDTWTEIRAQLTRDPDPAFDCEAATISLDNLLLILLADEARL